MGAPGPLHLITRTAEETRALGEALASVVDRGDVISLTGDLGAGKTTLIQGVARGLGVTEPVLSPTFTLVRQYEGRMRVYHLDVYRLERLQDVLDLGFDEMLDPSGLMVIEWGDAIAALLPEEFLEARMSLADGGPAGDAEAQGEGPRSTVLGGRGGSWGGRWSRLEAATSRWRQGSQTEGWAP
jgi:tRNA threonylcarbamoyladenosine biosynthesis protein TsaE